jgi:hypothetical protein
MARIWVNTPLVFFPPGGTVMVRTGFYTTQRSGTNVRFGSLHRTLFLAHVCLVVCVHQANVTLFPIGHL